MNPRASSGAASKNRDCKDCNGLDLVAFLTQIDIVRVQDVLIEFGFTYILKLLGLRKNLVLYIKACESDSICI